MGFFWTGPSGYNVLVRDSRAIESWGFQNVGRASWVMGGGRTLRFLNFFFFFFFLFTLIVLSSYVSFFPIV
uniref:Uncharacterized protein n=1 Tax=Candidozyma auris TaxID=498019 RepID=A0A0L0NN91_CANAR